MSVLIRSLVHPLVSGRGSPPELTCSAGSKVMLDPRLPPRCREHTRCMLSFLMRPYWYLHGRMSFWQVSMPKDFQKVENLGFQSVSLRSGRRNACLMQAMISEEIVLELNARVLSFVA